MFQPGEKVTPVATTSNAKPFVLPPNAMKKQDIWTQPFKRTGRTRNTMDQHQRWDIFHVTNVQRDKNILPNDNMGFYLLDRVDGCTPRNKLLKRLGTKYSKLDKLTKLVVTCTKDDLAARYASLKKDIFNA
jgi:hypothetical protein